MAQFQVSVPINLEYEGYHFQGPANTVFEIDDSLQARFDQEFSGRGLRGKLTWLVTDELDDLGDDVEDHEDRLTALEQSGSENHPDLAGHDALGLVTETDLDAHEVAADPHTVYALDSDLTSHVGAADPHTGYQRESEKGVADGYASLDSSGLIPDAQIPSSIARDSELPDLAGHVAAADPHTGYVREADANWVELTDGSETELHTHAGGGAHPDLATHDALGLATDAELTAHTGDTADAHDASAISVADSGGNFAATDVEAALEELFTALDADITDLADHLADTGDAHDASAISIADAGGDFTATDVEGALSELQADHEADAQALADHIADAADAHDASAISIADSGGDFTATDVEGALAELQADNEAHVAAGDPHTGYVLESAHTKAAHDALALSHDSLADVSANDHHNQAHAIGGADHTLSGGTAGHFLRATGASAFAFEAVPFSRGGTVLKTDGIADAALNVIVWRAPFACTVTAVKGYRVGGSGATVNARKNGSSNHLSSNLSLGSADAWADGGSVQNTSYAAGDKLEIMIVSASGSPTQIAVQVDFTRP